MATRDKKRLTQDSEIARFYLDLIMSYEKIGIGKTNSEGVTITKRMINTCKERFIHFALKAHKREIEYDK